MIISHTKKFIFIHNYKVAGTSIKAALNEYNNQSFQRSRRIDKIKFLLGIYPKIYSKQFSGHVKAIELKKQLTGNIFDRYYKFGFVRNPWDWQVSLYNYTLKLETHHQHEFIKSMKNFDEYIEWRVNNELRLQKEFFYEENKCLMDYIGKMENLVHDFNIICSKIHIKSTSLKNLNMSRKPDDHFLVYYSQKSIDLVDEAFQDDIQTFGYKKPSL